MIYILFQPYEYSKTIRMIYYPMGSYIKCNYFIDGELLIMDFFKKNRKIGTLLFRYLTQDFFYEHLMKTIFCRIFKISAIFRVLIDI